jgi:hypothetical protein
MDFRPLRFCPILLTSLLVGGAAPATAAPSNRPGKPALARSPSSAPTPIGLHAKKGTALAQCRIISIPTPMPPTPIIKKVEKTLDDSITLSELESAGEVVTPEGTWDATLTLDPDLPQPESPVALAEMPDDPERGVFAGLLEMKALLRLVNRDTGETFASSLNLEFSLAGPWAFDSNETPTDSDLAFFTDGEDGPTGPGNPGIVIDLVKKAQHCKIRLQKATPMPFTGTVE